MTFETIRVECDSRGIARLVLDRPQKHNALSAQMIAEIAQAIDALGCDESVRVVVLAGEGPSFCAGGDLGWMQQQMRADGPTRAAEAGRLAAMLGAVNRCPRPVIGRVHGNAFGGGIGLISVCDVAVGVDDARFGLTETRLGLIPATIGPYVVARMGESMARRVFMSGRLFGAEEAVQLGLLARVVAPGDLDDAVDAEIEPYLSCAPGAVAEAKALVRRLGAPIDDSVVAMTIKALVQRWESAEAAEGIAAFFEKRAPSWKRGPTQG